MKRKRKQPFLLAKPVPLGEKAQGGKHYAVASLKGQALQLAVEAGLIPEDGEGYRIGAFLKFWDSLEKLIEKKLEEDKEFMEMLKQQRDS